MRFKEIDVWLEAGREGKVFTYKDGKELGLSLGDLVLVTLRGRKTQGLVIETRIIENL